MESFMIWLIIAVVLMIIDGFTSSFILVWFGIAALLVSVLTALGITTIMQISIFIVVGTILAILLYPIAKQKFNVNKKTLPSREETYIGKVLRAQKEIKEKGSITVDGVLWNAINRGSPINEGDNIKIVGLEGNKIIIEKVEVE